MTITGRLTQIDSLTIERPSGETSVLDDVAANQRLLREGEKRPSVAERWVYPDHATQALAPAARARD